MKLFTHFGNEVTMQYGGDSFISYLFKNGMEYRVLPIIDDHYIVIAYKKDNITKYAVEIEMSPTSDDANAGYRIVITDTIPEDGWDNMLLDVVRQEGGYEPSKPKSYVKEVLERIDARIQEERAAKTDDSFLEMFEKTAE
ncbi:MAG: hypothetical protein IJT36_03280 [Alphaproteobacteria bacterium]|nr:hypothetical protein [Alphaproteobacteria bacterium]